jgi:TolB-like protein
MNTILEFSLYGACALRGVGSSDIQVRGVKNRALVAMLAMAPQARLTRSCLQETLWGRGDYETGHQNLRRALSDLRKQLGASFDSVLHVTATDIELNLEAIQFCGQPCDGAFLEDLKIREAPFETWLSGVCANPDALETVYKRQENKQRGSLKPRICALPLSVFGNDAALPAVADWVAEEACRIMSRSPFLAVISHLSGRAVASKTIDVSTIRKTLNVDYLLTGTLRELGDELVLDLDLIDTANGNILSNQNLVCGAANVVAAISEWLRDVVRNIGRTIANNALRDARAAPLPNLPSHGLLISGVCAMHSSNARLFMKSRDLIEEAVRRSPKSANARAWLGKWYILSIFKGISDATERDGQLARDCTTHALDLNPESSFAMTIDGFLHCNILRDFQTAEQRYFEALELSPNESLAWLLRGSLMAFRDEGSAAIRATSIARSLSPIDPFGYYFDSLASSAHLVGGEYEIALNLAQSSIRKNNSHLSTLRTRIAALHLLDRKPEARAAAQDLMGRFPNFKLEAYRRTHPSMGHKIGKTMVGALAASGIH